MRARDWWACCTGGGMDERSSEALPRVWSAVTVLLLLSWAAFAAVSLREARARSLELKAARVLSRPPSSTLSGRFPGSGGWGRMPPADGRRSAAFWVPPVPGDSPLWRRVCGGARPGAAGVRAVPPDSPAAGPQVPPAWRARGGAGFLDPPASSLARPSLARARVVRGGGEDPRTAANGRRLSAFSEVWARRREGPSRRRCRPPTTARRGPSSAVNHR